MTQLFDWDAPLQRDAQRHPIFEIADQLNHATDQYMRALDDEAEADVAYQRAYAIAFVKNGTVPATTRDKLTRAQCVDAFVDLRYAEAKAKRCRAKCDQLDRQLGAWQSSMRREERVT